MYVYDRMHEDLVYDALHLNACIRYDLQEGEDHHTSKVIRDPSLLLLSCCLCTTQQHEDQRLPPWSPVLHLEPAS